MLGTQSFAMAALRPSARGRALLVVALAAGISCATGQPIVGVPRGAIRRENAAMRAEERAENGEELELTRVMDNWGGEDWSRTGDAPARSGKQFKMTEAEASKVLPIAQRAAPCVTHLCMARHARVAGCARKQPFDFLPRLGACTSSGDPGDRFAGVRSERRGSACGDDPPRSRQGGQVRGGTLGRGCREHDCERGDARYHHAGQGRAGAGGAHREGAGAAQRKPWGGGEGKVPDVLPGMELSPIGQTEQGETPHDQARCLPFRGLATCT